MHSVLLQGTGRGQLTEVVILENKSAGDLSLKMHKASREPWHNTGEQAAEALGGACPRVKISKESQCIRPIAGTVKPELTAKTAAAPLPGMPSRITMR